MLPVLSVGSEHARGEPPLEGTVIQQAHYFNRIGIRREIVLGHIISERGVAKLEASVVIAAIAIAVHDPFAVTGFGEFERIDPLIETPLGTCVRTLLDGHRCGMLRSGRSTIVRV